MADTNIDYFSFVPNVFYQGVAELKTSYSDRTLSKNLFRRARIRPEIFGNTVIFQQYTVNSNVRPDQIADEIYGDSNLDWIVLLSNNIIDYYNEWPLSQEELQNYCLKKYGSDQKVNAIKHYVTREVRDDLDRLILNGDLIVGSDFTVSYLNSQQKLVTLGGSQLLTPVTNYQYEEEINNEKQQIYLLRPEFVGQTIQDLRVIMSYNDHSAFIDYVTLVASNVVK